MANEQRILVLEDSVEDAELIRLEIGRCPFPCEIRVVETKPDFQEALASFRPDLVVSDYSLPGFNGMEALRLLHATLPDVPLILVTGSIDEDTAVMCIKAGMSDYIIKDHIKRLSIAVTGALEEKKSRLERKEAFSYIQMNEVRLRLLYEVASFDASDDQGLLDFVLEQSVRLTQSRCGFLVQYDEGETLFTLMSQFGESTGPCPVAERKQEFRMAEAGVWAEVVGRKQPVLSNEAPSPSSPSLGFPLPHIETDRYLSVPVFRDDRVVALVGVAGKETDYNGFDIRQLSLFLEGAWRVVERNRSEMALRKSLEEKKVLLGELFHRSKNNLQIIVAMFSMQLHHEQDEKVSVILREMAARIQSMAIVHEVLVGVDDLSSVDLKNYVEKLCFWLVQNSEAMNVKVAVRQHLESVPVLIDVAMPCGLVLVELIGNAIRHAFPGGAGAVDVTLQAGPDRTVRLSVADDGVGLPPGFDADKDGGLGLQLVRLLGAGQLRGKLACTSTHPGTCWTLQFRSDQYGKRV